MAQEMSTQSHQGLLISFDGLDSSGKETQVHKLADRLRYNGWRVLQLQSPDYDTDSGRALKAHLQNKDGRWTHLPWEEKMRMFAENRAEHREEVAECLQRGDIVLYDRYIPSSLAFVSVEALAADASDEERDRVHERVRDEEHEVNGMPHEDVSLFLDVPPNVTTTLLEKRKAKLQDEDEYTDHVDIQRRLYDEYEYLIEQDEDTYVRIPCTTDGELIGIEATAEMVWTSLVQKFDRLAGADAR